MPTIAYIYGIAIRMFFRDHPPPHLLASYSGHEANIAIETGDTIAEHLPANAARLVKEWVLAHRDELEDSWQRARAAGRWSKSQVSTMTKVTKLNCLDGHRLHATFSDGTTGEHHFADALTETGPMIEPLRDPAFFACVLLDNGAPTWPNGYDMAPEWLRREIEAAGGLKRSAAA